MRLVKKPITLKSLDKMALGIFGDLVKAMVDIDKEIMVIGGEMHADEERVLLETGSNQDDLWGINIYPKLYGGNFIEFDSLINLRPRLKNFTRGIEDKKIKSKIIHVVNKLTIK